MSRTPQQRIRRALLAEAASGGHREEAAVRIARARVVLYDWRLSTQDGQSFAPHRIYAEARDWMVVAEVAYTARHGVSAMTCPLWPCIAELIDSGQVDGIVTSAWNTTDDKFLSWLLDHHVFVVCIDTATEAPAT
ncbi:hypothetical protein [Streptomyces sp. NBC_01766]|uniref:hypothetical protein n=1 Tax=Streptomyces sp. NBC_01766 TaxID=2975936 RepID=UPI002DDA0A80|nr:hypothetical protein [Streptomyces sp. NBC_01766]WSC21709.1 hypothetical protein OIE60_19620 [Streptomyces sp. NBC_01766]